MDKCTIAVSNQACLGFSTHQHPNKRRQHIMKWIRFHSNTDALIAVIINAPLVFFFWNTRMFSGQEIITEYWARIRLCLIWKPKKKNWTQWIRSRLCTRRCWSPHRRNCERYVEKVTNCYHRRRHRSNSPTYLSSSFSRNQRGLFSQWTEENCHLKVVEH